MFLYDVITKPELRLAVGCCVPFSTAQAENTNIVRTLSNGTHNCDLTGNSRSSMVPPFKIVSFCTKSPCHGIMVFDNIPSIKNEVLRSFSNDWTGSCRGNFLGLHKRRHWGSNHESITSLETRSCFYVCATRSCFHGANCVLWSELYWQSFLMAQSMLERSIFLSRTIYINM